MSSVDWNATTTNPGHHGDIWVLVQPSDPTRNPIQLRGWWENEQIGFYAKGPGPHGQVTGWRPLTNEEQREHDRALAVHKEQMKVRYGLPSTPQTISSAATLRRFNFEL